MPRRRSPHRFLTAALCFVAALAVASDSVDDWRWTGVERVVAFGDVHGAYHELVALLQRAGVIDGSLHWTGGTAHLVSLGDLVDRGPDSRAVLDLLMRLEVEAANAGGFVHVVLGNHEVMNLTGDHRYVSEADYASFAAGASGAALPGRAERDQAFSATGRYGAWLLRQPVLVVIDDTAFVHGGLPHSFAPLGVAEGNARFHEELLQALAPESMQGPLLSDNGPVWYRGTALCHVLIEGDLLRQSLSALSVQRVVIGHTPTRDLRARSRFDGAVVMLDTGMLAEFYHGRPSALVISGGHDGVLVADADTSDAVEPDPSPYSGASMARDRLAAMLESAAISSSTPVAGRTYGERVVTLVGPNGPIAARFVPLSKNRLRHELAAYQLDRLLGLGMIAPTVSREVDGKQGILAAVDANWTSERQRNEKGVARANPCEVGSDDALVLAFDVLIGNRARSVDNLGYDQRGEVRLRDHGDAFGTGGLARDSLLQPPKLPPALRDRLIALDERAIVDAVGDRLQPREIKALLARRNGIVGSWMILE